MDIFYCNKQTFDTVFVPVPVKLYLLHLLPCPSTVLPGDEKAEYICQEGRVLLVRCLLKTWSGLLIYFLMYNIRVQREFLNTLYICFADRPRLQNEMRGEVDKNFKN